MFCRGKINQFCLHFFPAPEGFSGVENLPGKYFLSPWNHFFSRVEMAHWFIHAVIAFFLFGLWGFFPKLSTNHINPKSALVYEVVGAMAVGLLALCLLNFKPEFHVRGILYAILTGMAGTLGVLSFFFAVSRGKASVVVTLTALYPLLTIILAHFILKEPVTLRQGVGMILALIAMLLLSA